VRLAWPALVVALAIGVPPVVSGAANDTIASFSLSGSPFAADFGPLPQRVELRLVLGRAAAVTATITTLDGTLVRTLAAGTSLDPGHHTWSWDGLNDVGSELPDGLYKAKVRAANGLGVAGASRQLRKGLPPIFQASPGTIVIVVDPGHGGRYPGACYQQMCEKDFNLDISLKLRGLLLAAGVHVVMTRTTDTAVDQPKSDVNGDGLANGYDDLAARNDIANLARADINIHNHLNSYGCRCTRGSEVFTNFKQPWSPAGIELATILDREQVTALDQFRDGTFVPIDRGVTNGNYYYMSPYSLVCPFAKGSPPVCKPAYQPRPSLMPSVLTESLFINNDLEFALVKRDDVRLALAASFYLAIAEYLDQRQLGIAYDLVSGPGQSATTASGVTYRVRVTNRGNAPSSGWRLQLRNVPFVPVYDGSPQIGSLMGEVVVPDGLQPGASVELDVHATAPPTAGNWWVKADTKLADGSHASAAGVVPLQVRLNTT
jgi:N-acetylmuramoyl-L-alanine amidase